MRTLVYCLLASLWMLAWGWGAVHGQQVVHAATDTFISVPDTLEAPVVELERPGEYEVRVEVRGLDRTVRMGIQAMARTPFSEEPITGIRILGGGIQSGEVVTRKARIRRGGVLFRLLFAVLQGDQDPAQTYVDWVVRRLQ